MAVPDAYTTVSTCDCDDKEKKTGDGGTVSRSGAPIQKPVLKRADDPKRYLGWSKGQTALSTKKKKFFKSSHMFSHTFNFPPACSVRVTVSGPRKFASLQCKRDKDVVEI